MPRTKKATAPKTAAVEVKKEAPVQAKAEAPVEVKTEVPAEVKKAAPKKTAPKKAAAPVEIVHVQFAGDEWTVSELVEKAKAAYAAAGGNVSEIKELQLYINPEEHKAYYVVNGEAAGCSIDL